MTTLEMIVLATMLVYFLAIDPLLSRREMKALHATPASAMPAARRRAYNRTIMFSWGLAVVLLAVWLLLGRGLNELGLHFQVEGWQWLAVGLSAAATLVFAVYSWRAADRTEDLTQTRDQLGNLDSIAPHTGGELRHFNWVAITAGICEEITYRGVLMTLLAGPLGIWPAVVVSSIVFGIGHSYQGASGILRTGLAGLFMALVVVFTGSLPLAMVIHALIDIVQGRLLHAVVNAPEPAADELATA